ncbi:nucleolar and spindle-associated protein 1 [Ctenodactylus gundi]
MTVPSAEELDSLKYSDLQNLAKSLGLRANLRADKLLRAVKAYLEQGTGKEKTGQDESQTCASSCDETEVQTDSQECTEREPADRVTTGRRRRRKTGLGNPDLQAPCEMHRCLLAELQPEGEGEKQQLGTAAEGPSQPGRSRRCSEGSEEPAGRKSLHADGPPPKLGKSKRTAAATPNFKKLHEAHFKEMESIDEYIKRKKKHFEEQNSSEDLKKQPSSKGGAVTPVCPGQRPSGVRTPGSRGRRLSPGSARPAHCSGLGLQASTRRAVLSAAKMTVRFSAATKDNEHKCSLIKTPSRKSPHASLPGATPRGHAVLGTPRLKKVKAATVITPFKVTTALTGTPISNKKPVFDLKASLSRPLNYEPHKGKLKPWGQSKENTCLNEYMNRVSFHKKTYKQPRLQSREEQRKKREQERKEKKEKVLGARRGLTTAKEK